MPVKDDTETAGPDHLHTHLSSPPTGTGEQECLHWEEGRDEFTEGMVSSPGQVSPWVKSLLFLTFRQENHYSVAFSSRASQLKPSGRSSRNVNIYIINSNKGN